MGYRSEVILCVGNEVMPQFLTTLAKCPEARELCFKHTDEMIKDYDGTGNLLFRWDYIKWYQGYDPIDALSDFMDWCDGEEIEVDGDSQEAAYFFRFVRVGEEMEDSVVRGYGFEDVGIERRISH